MSIVNATPVATLGAADAIHQLAGIAADTPLDALRAQDQRLCAIWNIYNSLTEEIYIADVPDRPVLS